MKKLCKSCGIEKEEKDFVQQIVEGKLRVRNKCKECKNKSRRTGKPNSGRFKIGGHPGKEFQKGHTPWYKIAGVDAPSKGKGKKESRFHSAKYHQWRSLVLQRDEYKCTKCGSENRLAAHHIIPWKESESMRFNLENGLTLCCVCHGNLEGFGTKKCS